MVDVMFDRRWYELPYEILRAADVIKDRPLGNVSQNLMDLHIRQIIAQRCNIVNNDDSRGVRKITDLSLCGFLSKLLRST
jgi:hypothetical protein